MLQLQQKASYVLKIWPLDSLKFLRSYTTAVPLHHYPIPPHIHTNNGGASHAIMTAAATAFGIASQIPPTDGRTDVRMDPNSLMCSADCSFPPPIKGI